MNLPFGLRLVEHTAWVRELTRTDINASQSHGAALSYNSGAWRGEAMLLGGNMQLTPTALRERGATAYLEYAFTERLAAGASSLVTHTNHDLALKRAAFRQAHGAFVRYTPIRPLVISGELDLLVSSPIRRSIETGYAGLLQLDVEPVTGLHAILTGEVARSASDTGANRARGWASLAWFFLPHVDIRADVIQEFTSGGTLTLLGQIHAFL
jgi:hypothetical protein